MPRYGDKTFHGNKNSGTKTKYEFAAEVLNNGLANIIVNEELLKLKKKKVRGLESMKIIVMPIATKGMTDRKVIQVQNFDELLDELE